MVVLTLLASKDPNKELMEIGFVVYALAQDQLAF